MNLGVIYVFFLILILPRSLRFVIYLCVKLLDKKIVFLDLRDCGGSACLIGFSFYQQNKMLIRFLML